MSEHLLECPACHVSFPVDRDTMRPAKYGYAHKVEISEFQLERIEDRCHDESCRCNQDPEPAA